MFAKRRNHIKHSTSMTLAKKPDRMRGSSLDKAIDIVQRAIDHDSAHNYPEACKEYLLALDFFMLALKYESNKQFKLLIRSKIEEYLERAEFLKAHLAQNAPTTTIDARRITVPTDPDIQRLRATVLTETPNINWDDVAGLEAAKVALKEAVIVPVRFPQLFTGKRLPWKGILLYGPPGTGKSYLAKAVATEAKSTFFSVSSSDLVSKWQGDSERLVKQLFQMARELKPSIIFIDEIDSLVTSRNGTDSEASNRIKTEFLVQMDGVGRDSTGVLVIGATNRPWDIDPSIRRRFEKRIHIPLPDLPSRRRMLELHVGSTPSALTPSDYNTLAERTEYFSGADVGILVRDALMQPIRKFMAATHFKPVEATGQWSPCSPGDAQAIEKTWTDLQSSELHEPSLTLKDFLKSLEVVRPSVLDSDVQRYTIWTADFGE
ncbi:AAA-domain-containing protein [Mycena floridula]|nr:AAA-domain-containing protein [Mycena floridula]